MKKIILFVVILLLLLISFLVKSKGVIAEDVVPDEFLSTEVLIKKYAGSQAELLTKVMMCESGGKQSAVGDGGKAIGVLQFHRGTFERYSEWYGHKLNINSSLDQIKLGGFIFQNYPKEKRAWTCVKKVI